MTFRRSRPAALAAELAASDADILVLQEYLSRWHEALTPLLARYPSTRSRSSFRNGVDPILEPPEFGAGFRQERPGGRVAVAGVWHAAA